MFNWGVLSICSAYTITIVQRSSNHNYSLHTQRVFTQVWPSPFWPAVASSILPFISHGKQFDECSWRRISLPSRNLYNCKQVACSIVVTSFVLFRHFLYRTSLLLVYFLIPLFYTDVVVVCLLLYALFISIMLLLYFCLFVDHVKKPIIFSFGTFVYYFKNTISIFVTLYNISK